MDLALFDLDETLICDNSTSLWLRWLVSQGFAPASMIEQEQALTTQYDQGALSMNDYMNTLLAPLAGMGTLTVSGWVRRFIQRDILPRVYPSAREKIAWHQQRGDTVMIVSGSGEHLVVPIAQHLGAHGACATGVEIIDDRYSGRHYGSMTWQQEGPATDGWLTVKARCHRTWAYSDSISDLSMLEQADHACVINPAESLHQLAQQRGWEVCRWVK
ncbi:HAD family hydrolase [Erwinia sp. BNK-24-b]|uniref:HAD family hydrolase n=1 Tax=unclassified Erwinia TaxID=2622719 RepID=UPI0039BF370B